MNAFTGAFTAARRVSAPAGPIVLANRQALIIGDSRAAGTSALNTRLMKANGVMGWLMSMTNHRIEFPIDGNFGVSGNTTDMVIERLDAINAHPASIGIWILSTNDFGYLAEFSAQKTIDNWRTMLRSRHGKLDFICCELGRTGLSAAQAAKYAVLRNWFRFQMQSEFPNTVPVDLWDRWNDPALANAAPYDGLTYDGLHENIVGAQLIASAFADAINQRIPEGSLALLAANNTGASTRDGWLNANPMLNGATGTMSGGPTGQVATGYALAMAATAAGLTVVASKNAAGADGFEEQVLTVSGTPTGASPSLSFRHDFSAALLQAGESFESAARIDVDAGSTGLLAVTLESRIDPNLSFARYFDAVTSSMFYSNKAAGGVQRTWKATKPESGSTTHRAGVSIFMAQNVPVQAVVRISRLSARRVP